MTTQEIVSVEALDRATCWSLLERQSVGRVAMLRRRRPMILPITYTIDGEIIVYRTAEGAALVPFGSAEDMAFEIDGIDEERQLGWSVLVVGRATIMRDRPEIERLAAGLEPWAPGDRSVFVALRADEVSGRQVVRTRGQRLVTSEP
jgi:nitroimidazol reductase NimA-like FMN-containing flavoprotein (pyridoxamine 5'-phosphate oxidase superfamily)